MVKTLEDYADLLPPIPASIPGLFRWRQEEQRGYPFLFIDIWEEKFSFWTNKPKGGKWVVAVEEMMWSGWRSDPRYGVPTAAHAALVKLNRKYGTPANTVLAVRV